MDIPVASNFSLFTSLQESPYIWLLGTSQKIFFFFQNPLSTFPAASAVNGSILLAIWR